MTVTDMEDLLNLIGEQLHPADVEKLQYLLRDSLKGKSNETFIAAIRMLEVLQDEAVSWVVHILSYVIELIYGI